MWARPARDALLYWQGRLSGAGADEVVFRGLVDSPDAGGPERGNPGILCERDALPANSLLKKTTEHVGSRGIPVGRVPPRGALEVFQLQSTLVPEEFL